MRIILALASPIDWRRFDELAFHSIVPPAGTVAVAQGAADRASGTLQIAKQQFPLKHAFAAMEADPFSNGEKENLVVLGYSGAG
jgi:hypothetical protein